MNSLPPAQNSDDLFAGIVPVAVSVVVHPSAEHASDAALADKQTVVVTRDQNDTALHQSVFVVGCIVVVTNGELIRNSIDFVIRRVAADEGTGRFEEVPVPAPSSLHNVG